ncbi:metabolite traffic protein EboE [Algoriphagus pacificus]|uniref:Metabolite traffic protein EboE n=1 Tax=Algoriphagus pacificus TaxID=2811234 RepID=A0ABS3CIW8_9BACT|nr:metabolite traffic protein EboE [Algoriphagus pacificus]MBN7817043.1 metabolite traffic protein EboE [Algoriphagus pacificus]
MLIEGKHLSYCTNIHPGESWKETFENLKKYIPQIKSDLAPDQAFGIGLRLSNEASLVLAQPEELTAFKSWLKEQNAYVFTMNGFPYGGFHGQVVKDDVHTPDWTTKERRDYTIRLFEILAELLPDQIEGGISTSPLSYRFWFSAQNELDRAITKSTTHLVQVVAKLIEIKQKTGKTLHLDIEPEPDGILENTAEMLAFFKDWLLPMGTRDLMDTLQMSKEDAEKAIKEHIRLCYDVCHFALVYEKPKDVFQAMDAAGIKIGKIQISAALKLKLPKGLEERNAIKDTLLPFAESTYLHQVIGRNSEGQLESFRDLDQALKQLESTELEEWRIHFHVPVFLSDYGKVASTQSDILEVLTYLKTNQVTDHLEVETYTWDVLPEGMTMDIQSSIIRELSWVTENMKQS